MRVGSTKGYRDAFKGKDMLVKVVAILKVEDAANKEDIGKNKIMVQENDLSDGFLVDPEQLYEVLSTSKN